jgi:RNA polymerase sigma-70 factor (ECF subfamily)
VSDSDDDIVLVARIRRRDPVALGLYLEARRDAILAYIERQLGAQLRRKVEPDDILQEVSVEAVRALPSIDLEGREPLAWLCQVAERRIIDAHRRFFDAQKRSAGREVPLDAGDSNHAGLVNLLVVTMTTPSQAFSRDQREFRLHQAIEKLPTDCRDALRMRYVDGMPSKEIAEKLGKSDGAVRVMLTRSLKKLQELLGDG